MHIGRTFKHLRKSRLPHLLFTSLLIASCTSGTEQKAKNSGSSPPTKVLTETTGVETTPQYFVPTAYQVPFDLSTPPLANKSDETTKLATFAWKEFIALNWPSTYGTTANPTQRATPDTTKTILDFASPDNSGQLVWQTYKHRNEVYPMVEPGVEYPNSAKNFDETPYYTYPGVDSSSIPLCGAYDPTSMTWAINSSSTLANVTYFNNLDETSEIDLATLFKDGDPNAPGIAPPSGTPNYMDLPKQPRRYIYEAKANRTMFDYISGAGYYDTNTRLQAQLATYTAVRQEEQGGLSTCPDATIICFPHGVKSTSPTQAQEGTILVKATWRQLTQTEYQSGRYLTAPIIKYRNYDPAYSVNNPDAPPKICYETVSASPTSTSLPYGLVGLHIIHKTTNYPTYVFATFEQIDNLSQENSLYYYNRTSVSPAGTGRQTVNHRAHPIPQEIKDVTDQVHFQLRTALDGSGTSDSVWLYYKLIGVQGEATNSDNATSESEFALANLVTETNETLRDFSGTLNADGTTDPNNSNIYKGATQIIGGGCKGCHGNAQVGPHVEFGGAAPDPSSLIASDFSFITQNAPFDGVPDAVNQPLIKDETN